MVTDCLGPILLNTLPSEFIGEIPKSFSSSHWRSTELSCIIYAKNSTLENGLLHAQKAPEVSNSCNVYGLITCLP